MVKANPLDLGHGKNTHTHKLPTFSLSFCCTSSGTGTVAANTSVIRGKKKNKIHFVLAAMAKEQKVLLQRLKKWEINDPTS